MNLDHWHLWIRKEGQFGFVFDPTNNDPKFGWLRWTVTVPRSLCEWRDTIEALRKPLWAAQPPNNRWSWTPPEGPPYVAGGELHPFFHRAAAAELLETWWYRNQRIRWLCRKWLARRRWRIISQRPHHGSQHDLATCEPIPERHRVTVFDVKSRSIYHFHVKTVHSTLLRDLLYQRYAVSEPQMPKNPYTNLPWTVGQLVAIVGQLQTHLWNAHHRFVDSAIFWFRRASYTIPLFVRYYGHRLTFRCARDFFLEPTNDGWEEEYEDAFNSLVGEARSHLVPPAARQRVCDYLIHRSMPPAMLATWDNLIIAFWMFANVGSWAESVTLGEVVTSARKELVVAHKWIQEGRKPPPKFTTPTNNQ